eukprot:11814935-Heterocapsa_arctica.AAC.1
MESAGRQVPLLCLWRSMPWPGRAKARARAKEAYLLPAKAKARARARRTWALSDASGVACL